MRSEEKWREMLSYWICVCVLYLPFNWLRAKEVRIDIKVKRSEEKWREVMACDVSPVAMFFTFLVSAQVFWVTFFVHVSIENYLFSSFGLSPSTNAEKLWPIFLLVCPLYYKVTLELHKVAFCLFLCFCMFCFVSRLA